MWMDLLSVVTPTTVHDKFGFPVSNGPIINGDSVVSFANYVEMFRSGKSIDKVRMPIETILLSNASNATYLNKAGDKYVSQFALDIAQMLKVHGAVVASYIWRCLYLKISVLDSNERTNATDIEDKLKQEMVLGGVKIFS
jgi:hypothetical protein